MSPDRLRYRRSPHLIIHWDAEKLVLHNYATGARVYGSPLVVRLMASLTGWRSLGSIANEFSEFDPALLRELLDKLHDLELVHQADQPPTHAERALESWHQWSPAAAFLHLSTKDATFDESVVNERALREKARVNPPPSPVKRLKRSTRVHLPTFEPRDHLEHTLVARRTWRRFGDAPLDICQLSTLLGLTWGVQKWVKIDGQGTVALKTGPSGGARHNLEAYVLLLRAAGLEPGLYHYDPNGHALQLLRRNCSRHDIAAFIPKQPWYEHAAALVFMTAVFGRAQWRYTYPRAYRSVLLEAGHFCQTFCLLATSLRLAPFCTAALADSVVERALQVDGIRESVLYACGVAARPPDTDWAPWPHSTELPQIFPPQHRTRRPKRTR